MYPPPFEYERPESLEDALDLLAQHGVDTKILAGGHSLLPRLKLRELRPALIIDVNRVSELAGAPVVNETLVIPSLTRHIDVARSAAVSAAVPLLGDVASQLGDPQVRNVGTVGGAASEIYAGADWAPALITLGAQLVCRNRAGERTISARDQFASDDEVALAPDEILVRIEVPVPGPRSGGAHLRLERRTGVAVCNCSAQVRLDEAGRYASVAGALGGLRPGPVVPTGLAELLVGEEPSAELHSRTAREALRPVESLSGVGGSSVYRRKVAATVLSRALDTAFRRANGEHVKVRDVV